MTTRADHLAFVHNYGTTLDKIGKRIETEKQYAQMYGDEEDEDEWQLKGRDADQLMRQRKLLSQIYHYYSESNPKDDEIINKINEIYKRPTYQNYFMIPMSQPLQCEPQLKLMPHTDFKFYQAYPQLTSWLKILTGDNGCIYQKMTYDNAKWTPTLYNFESISGQSKTFKEFEEVRKQSSGYTTDTYIRTDSEAVLGVLYSTEPELMMRHILVQYLVNDMHDHPTLVFTQEDFDGLKVLLHASDRQFAQWVQQEQRTGRPRAELIYLRQLLMKKVQCALLAAHPEPAASSSTLTSASTTLLSSSSTPSTKPLIVYFDMPLSRAVSSTHRSFMLEVIMDTVRYCSKPGQRIVMLAVSDSMAAMTRPYWSNWLKEPGVYNPEKSPQNLLIWNQFVTIDADGRKEILKQYLKKYNVNNAAAVISEMGTNMNGNQEKAKQCLGDLLRRQSSLIASQATDKIINEVIKNQTDGWMPFGMSGYMISNLLVPYLLHMAVREKVKDKYITEELGAKVDEIQAMITKDARAAREFESQLNHRVNEYLGQAHPNEEIAIPNASNLVVQVQKMFKDLAEQYSPTQVSVNEQGGDFYSFVVREYKLWLTHIAYYMGWVLPYQQIQTPQSLYLNV